MSDDDLKQGMLEFPDLLHVEVGTALPIIVARLVRRIKHLEERIRSLESSRK